MADRDVTGVVLTSIVSILRREGVANAPAVGRELIGIAKSHGVRFAAPVHRHDPNADLHAKPEPGDQQAGLIAALAALGKGLCRGCGDRIELGGDGRIVWHEITDDGHPPYRICTGWKQLPHTAETLAAAEAAAATDRQTDDLEQQS